MQASLIFAVIGLLASSSHAGKLPECAQLDPDLVYCPQVQAPRVTELAPGSAVVAFTVQPDGSVSNAHVVQSDNAQWNSAAIQAVSHWRFKQMGRSVQKSKHLQFGFQP